MVVTTPRLVALLTDDTMMKDTSLYINATYKLNWKRYPILIAPILNEDYNTQAAALALSSHEHTKIFEFILGILQQAPQRFGGLKYQQNSIMADGVGAISSSVYNIFRNSYKRGMCWAYMFQNVDKQMLAIRNGVQQDKIKDAVWVLQLRPTLIEFQYANQLFYEWLGKNLVIYAFKHYVWAQWMGPLPS